MLTAAQVPTLQDPEALFKSLVLWAGIPGGVTLFALLALYQAVKSWLDLGRNTRRGFAAAQNSLRQVTSEQQRAAVGLSVWSALAVAIIYSLAVIVDTVVEVVRAHPNGTGITSAFVESSVVATQWSPASVWAVVLSVAGILLLGLACVADLVSLRKLITFLGGVACVAAFIAAAGLGIDSLIGFAVLHSQNPPPLSLVVLELITAIMCGALGFLLVRIRTASGTAFNAR